MTKSVLLAEAGLKPSSIAHFQVKDEPMEQYGSRDLAETSGHRVSVDMRNEPYPSSPFSKEAEEPHLSWGIFSCEVDDRNLLSSFCQSEVHQGLSSQRTAQSKTKPLNIIPTAIP